MCMHYPGPNSALCLFTAAFERLGLVRTVGRYSYPQAPSRRLVLAGVLFEDSQPRLARPGGEPAQQRTVRQSDCCKRSESDEDSDFE